MDEKRSNKIKVQIIFSAMIFTIILFLELYIMVNYKENYIAIGSFMIVSLLSLAFIISGLIELMTINNEKRTIEYESLNRSDKATYLMTKKGIEDILYRLERVERVALVPTEEIVSAQKGIAKVIINRNRENAEAIMNSNDLLNERFDEFESRLKNNNREQIDETKAVNTENLQHFLEKQQEVVVNLKDMEIRLNTSIMQAQKMIAEQKSLLQQPQIIQQPFIQSAPIQPAVYAASSQIPAVESQRSIVDPLSSQSQDSFVSENQTDIDNITNTVQMDFMQGEQESQENEDLNDLSLDSISNISDDEDIIEEKNESKEEKPGRSMSPDEIAALLEDMTKTEEDEVPAEDFNFTSDSSEATSSMPDLSDPNKMMSPDEIAALVANTGGGSEPEPKPAMPDLSDPNKMMSPDEIAALVANAGGSEPEEKPAMPDLSDPNKMMSPDEIAALVANAGVSAEPEPEPMIEVLDLSDPNKMMTPDEIAALVANANNEPETNDILPDQIISELNMEFEKSVPIEEKPPMPDLSDPNKKMSADEIAALFANMA